jgi:hypothetical protein
MPSRTVRSAGATSVGDRRDSGSMVEPPESVSASADPPENRLIAAFEMTRSKVTPLRACTSVAMASSLRTSIPPMT